MNILNVIEVIVAIILIIFIVLLHTSNKKLKLYRVVFLEITLVAIFGHVGYNLFFKQPTIEILGDKKIVIEAGRDYEDKGAKAKLRGKDISKTLKVKNEVNPKKPGEYKVYYELIYKNKLIKVERTVYVKDETAPTLKLKGSSTINVPLIFLFIRFLSLIAHPSIFNLLRLFWRNGKSNTSVKLSMYL